MKQMIFRVCLVAASALSLSGFLSAQWGAPSEHLRPGLQLLQQQEYPQTMAAFELLVTVDPEDGEAWNHLGLARHSGGLLDEAIRAHLMAKHLIAGGGPLHVAATYNVACVYALQGKTERALIWLQRARNVGFSNFSLVATDSDLDSLRADPRFAEFQQSGPLLLANEGLATVSFSAKGGATNS